MDPDGRAATRATADARAGDLVQYWMKRQDGTWFGHSAVIESVEVVGGVPRAGLYGAHASLGKIGSSAAANRIRLVDAADRRIYIVRLND